MKSKKPTITGLLITYNEEKHIKDAIGNLSFVDELIVVDSFSTDRTVEIASQFPNVEVYQKEFVNFSDQRNFAIKKAKKDWIIFLDADERLTPSLIAEMKSVIKIPSNVVAYKVKRQFMFKDRKLRYSGFQTDYSFRLFKRAKGSYGSHQKVHETLHPMGATATLQNEILHYSYEDYDSFKVKVELYAQLKAEELLERGKEPNWFSFHVKPVYKFIYNYIFRLGILDGRRGMIICKLQAHGVRHRYNILKKLLLSQPK